jgi:hypothetical protein
VGKSLTVVHYKLLGDLQPDNTHHHARVTMKKGESPQDYTNRFFENSNQLVGVKDEDVIIYYKKGITNINPFEKIHVAGVTTIADLMSYVDKSSTHKMLYRPRFQG